QRHRDRVRAFILADTNAAFVSEPRRREQLALAQQTEALGSARPAVDLMMPRLIRPGIAAADPLIEQVRQMVAGTSPRTIAETQRHHATSIGDADLPPTINVPTLVIVGEHDATVPLDRAEGLARAIPGARLVVVPNAGHMSNLENPAAFNAALASFLATLAT